jgi:hypothetical protein
VCGYQPFLDSLLSDFVADTLCRVQEHKVLHQLAGLSTEVISTVNGVVDCQPPRESPTECVASYNVAASGTVQHVAEARFSAASSIRDRASDMQGSVEIEKQCGCGSLLREQRRRGFHKSEVTTLRSNESGISFGAMHSSQ